RGRGTPPLLPGGVCVGISWKGRGREAARSCRLVVGLRSGRAGGSRRKSRVLADIVLLTNSLVSVSAALPECRHRLHGEKLAVPSHADCRLHSGNLAGTG